MPPLNWVPEEGEGDEAEAPLNGADRHADGPEEAHEEPLDLRRRGDAPGAAHQRPVQRQNGPAPHLAALGYHRRRRRVVRAGNPHRERERRPRNPVLRDEGREQDDNVLDAADGVPIPVAVNNIDEAILGIDLAAAAPAAANVDLVAPAAVPVSDLDDNAQPEEVQVVDDAAPNVNPADEIPIINLDDDAGANEAREIPVIDLVPDVPDAVEIPAINPADIDEEMRRVAEILLEFHNEARVFQPIEPAAAAVDEDVLQAAEILMQLRNAGRPVPVAQGPPAAVIPEAAALPVAAEAAPPAEVAPPAEAPAEAAPPVALLAPINVRLPRPVAVRQERLWDGGLGDGLLPRELEAAIFPAPLALSPPPAAQARLRLPRAVTAPAELPPLVRHLEEELRLEATFDMQDFEGFVRQFNLEFAQLRCLRARFYRSRLDQFVFLCGSCLFETDRDNYSESLCHSLQSEHRVAMYGCARCHRSPFTYRMFTDCRFCIRAYLTGNNRVTVHAGGVLAVSEIID